MLKLRGVPLKLRAELILVYTNYVDLARVCKRCGQGFEVDYTTGRPREYCFKCEPSGWRVVFAEASFWPGEAATVAGLSPGCVVSWG